MSLAATVDRSVATRRRWSRFLLVCLLALGLVGCSPPPPEEVIVGGRLPADGEPWCQVVDDEAIAQLVGADGMDRILQKGDLGPDRAYQGCRAFWADEDEPVEVLTVEALSTPPSSDYVIDLENLVAMHDHTVVEPGVYVVGGRDRDRLRAFLACDTGDRMPSLLLGILNARPAEGGERWARDTLETHAARLAAVTERVHECPGDVWPLTPEDGERLIDEFLSTHPSLL